MDGRALVALGGVRRVATIDGETSIAPPDGLIDLTVDPRQLPPATAAGATRPARVLRDEDFWVQGVSLGVEWRY